ncbi:hypothetical protein ACQKLX_10010 [Bosea sp. NPDC003192]|uniref:hypothetical protein n=1 Tax=Bosea sp. NPDC003192 TaxID=3390551 RepID=UPI003D079677
MNMRALVTAAMFVLWAPFCQAEELRPSAGTERDRAVFIGTVALTLNNANVQLIAGGEKALFCKPGVMVTSAEAWAAASAALKGPHEPTTIVTAAIDGLRRAYPCSR